MMPFALRYWLTKGALNGGNKSASQRVQNTLDWLVFMHEIYMRCIRKSFVLFVHAHALSSY